MDLGFDGLESSCWLNIFPGECVTEDDPVAFIDEDDMDHLAVGAEARVEMLVHDSLTGFRIRSSDPDVATAELDAGDVVVVRALAEGSVRIDALADDSERVWKSMSIEVERFAETQFFYYASGGEPLPELAGRVGSAEVLYAAPSSAGGTPLQAEGAVEYSVEGSISLGGQPEVRGSDLVRALWGETLGTPLTVSFDAEGPGRVVTRAIDGSEHVFAIHGVSAADEHRIEADRDLKVGEPAYLSLHGATAGGLTVAGVRGTWSVEPADLVVWTVGSAPVSEIQVEPTGAGVLTVEVEVDGTTVTEELQIGE